MNERSEPDPTGRSDDRFVKRDCIDLRVRQAGGSRRLGALWVRPVDPVPGRLPLVLLHEGLGSIAQWTHRGLDVPAVLAARTGRPVFVYERLGFGRSDPLPAERQPDYLYEEGETVLPQVLDAAGIDRAVLLGHSDGGSIALIAAAAHPDRVAGVAMEAAHVIVEAETLDGIRVARAAYAEPGSRLRAALTRYHGDKADRTFAGWADVWLTPAFAGFDMVDRLPAIRCPVLAIQGDADEYGTPEQLRLIAEGAGGPCDTWLIPDCRHVPRIQAHQAVIDRLAGFYAALP